VQYFIYISSKTRYTASHEHTNLQVPLIITVFASIIVSLEMADFSDFTRQHNYLYCTNMQRVKLQNPNQ